jgi:transcriptional regulator with XRE-family HTH domain
VNLPASDGAELKRPRRECALSQQELGRRTGIAHSTISNLEFGNRASRLACVRKLAEALGVEPKELMKSEWAIVDSNH